jgi:hypothetical protein
LLVDRIAAAQMLGSSTGTIKRMEERGILHARRLSPSASAKAYYDVNEIKAVATKGVPVGADAARRIEATEEAPRPIRPRLALDD